jgi:hypothetical protein
MAKTIHFAADAISDKLKTLSSQDGAMLIVVRGGGAPEVIIPQLGLLTEARLEMSLPFIYREIMAARAKQMTEQKRERIEG